MIGFVKVCLTFIQLKLLVVGGDCNASAVYVHKFPEVVFFAFKTKLTPVIKVMHGVKGRDADYGLYKRLDKIFHVYIIQLLIIIRKQKPSYSRYKISRDTFCKQLTTSKKRIIIKSLNYGKGYNMSTKNFSCRFLPQGEEKSITHMCFAAHYDDIEFMAYHGILQCFGKNDKWFGGVVVTDGAGSPRSGLYASYTDEQMKSVRLVEQKKAAVIGEYGVMYCLGYTSSEVKQGDREVVDKIAEIIAENKPEIIYTHNPADKHDTHCAVALRVIAAIRQLPVELRPKKLLGCEVWRDLDWVNDDEKLFLDVSGHPNIAMSLASVFDSQIQGGKRYDLACDGRRLANATYYASHSTDTAERANYAIDMTPLISGGDVIDFIDGYIDSFKNDVDSRIKRLKG